MSEFSHLNKDGKATMVDVGGKSTTKRYASAMAKVYLPDEVMLYFNGHDVETKKGGVFQSAIIAGIMGAKKTSELIPLCHPLAITGVDVTLEPADDAVGLGLAVDGEALLLLPGAFDDVQVELDE